MRSGSGESNSLSLQHPSAITAAEACHEPGSSTRACPGGQNSPTEARQGSSSALGSLNIRAQRLTLPLEAFITSCAVSRRNFVGWMARARSLQSLSRGTDVTEHTDRAQPRSEEGAAPGWGWSFPCGSQHLPEQGSGGRRGNWGENTPSQLRTVLLLSWGCSHPISPPPTQPWSLCTVNPSGCCSPED